MLPLCHRGPLYSVESDVKPQIDKYIRGITRAQDELFKKILFSYCNERLLCVVSCVFHISKITGPLVLNYSNVVVCLLAAC